MIRVGVSLLGGIALAAMMTGAASANPIFSDDFNRPNNSIVGNGWVETNDNANPNDVSISGNELVLSKNKNATATHGASTLNMTNIVLSYDWRGVGTENGDLLKVFWSTDNTNYTLLVTHDLGSPGPFAHDSISLGLTAENLTNIDIRFTLVANMGNDFAHIDNVSVAGDVKQQQEGGGDGGTPLGVPEPATLAVMGFGLAAAGAFRRRRKTSRPKA